MIEEPEAPPPEPIPLCPHCRELLPQFACTISGSVQLAPLPTTLLVVVTYCPHCSVLLGAQLVPAMPASSGRPPIVIPGDKFRR